MQPSPAISENVFLKDLQAGNSPQYTLSIYCIDFHHWGLWICLRMHLCMCVYERAVGLCGWAQPESTVKWRTGNINRGHLYVHENILSVTYEPDVLLGWQYELFCTGGRILFGFCRGNSYRDLLSLHDPLWIGGRGNHFCTQQLGHFNKAPIFESLSSVIQANIRMKEKQERHH